MSSVERNRPKIIATANEYFSHLNSVFNIQPPFDTIPEYSNKLIDDIRFVILFESITRWYSSNTLSSGNLLRSPILNITTIFEHYCFIRLVDSFLLQGYKQEKCVIDGVCSDEVSSICLSRNEEYVYIFYEPTINSETLSPLKYSKSGKGYRPDFIIFYRHKQDITCGVVDAKFSDLTYIDKYLAPEIFYKYGLFLHKPNGSPIDFVLAMYPGSGNIIKFTDCRNHLSNSIRPILGTISISFSDGKLGPVGDFFERITSLKSA